MTQDSEKRKYIRSKKLFSLELRNRPDKGHKATSADWNMVSAWDLSEGGAFFYYNKDSEIGSLVEVKICIPESTTTIYCKGKIIRAKKNLKPSIYDAAVEFTEINEEAKEIIKKYVINKSR